MSAVRSFVGGSFKGHEYVTKEIIQEISKPHQRQRSFFINLSFKILPKIYFENMLQYKTSVRWVVEKLIRGIKLEIRPYHQNECELK